MSLTIDPQVEIYVVSTTEGAGWLNISDLDLVRSDGADAIEIQHGSQGMLGGIPEPSSCTMVWDGRAGRLWPKNVTSDLYGSLDLNTPLRVALGLFAHVFPGTVVDDWSDVGGYPVVNTGSGGSVLASDWQQTPGVGTHSVPTTSAHRKTMLDGFDLENCEQTIEYQLPVADVTGGAIEPANLVWRSIATDDTHIFLRVSSNTDETITMKFIRSVAGVESDETSTYTASITNSGQWLKVKGNIEGHRLQAKIWDPDDSEPLAWLVDESAGTLLAEELVPGEIGVRTGVASGNTNAKPIVVSYRNWTVRSLPFHGELADYRMETDSTGNEIRIRVVAAGITRRLDQGTPPTLSALRRAIPLQSGVQAYWALEDKAGATQFGSGLPGHPPMIPVVGTPGYAEYSDLDASQPLPTGNGSEWRGVVPDYTDTGNIQISFVLHLPAGDQADRTILCRWYTGHASAILWQLIYRSGGGDLQLQAWNSESAFVYESSVLNANLNDTNRLVSVQLSDDGSDVDWAIRALNMDTGAVDAFYTGTTTGVQIASVKAVWMNLSFLDTPAFGHVTVQSVLTDFFELSDESVAWHGESCGLRLARLLDEANIECTRERGYTAEGELEMGPQEPADTPTLLEECVTLDSGGVWFDGRSYAGINYRHRGALYNQPTWITLSKADGHLQPDWRPVYGDRDIRNKITVSRDGGGEATYALETGRLSILPVDEGGAGEYTTNVPVSAEDDSLLQQIAAFRVALGTQDTPIYPAAVVELNTPALLADPAIGNRLLDLRPGRIVEITDAADVFEYDPIPLMVVGYTERISQFLHSYELSGEPAAPFTVWELEHATLGALDSRSSTLTDVITSSATSFDVTSTGCLWTTDPAWFPLDIRVGGERMTCTGITSTLPAYIAAGTTAHADNASVSPGVPGGATAAGDDMVMFTRGRAQAANDPASWSGGSGAGWDTVILSGTFTLFRKTHTGSESAPTVTWPAGAAGDVNSAVTISVSDLGDLIASAGTSVGGGGSQNIPYLTLSGTVADGIAFFAGAKADDWTSVATITGATEIVDSPTTVGNDHGLVVDYMTHNGSVTGLPVMTTQPGEFAVTGGVAATNRSLVLIFGNHQRFTVTRHPTAATAHPAGAEVHISYEPRYAL